ncbi:major facilitator superfamily transporter [Xylariaceae sp. FL1651]|nr:major facilitator superfamily transporter [Xylariaceae sp. FL1651]
MSSLMRDTPVGQFVRLVTRNRMLQYPEEKADFQLPDAQLKVVNSDKTEYSSSSTCQSDASTLCPLDEKTQVEKIDEETLPSQSTTSVGTESPAETLSNAKQGSTDDIEQAIEKIKSIPIVPRRTEDGTILVDWYSTDDPENPQNWANSRRLMVAIVLCLYTFVVYTSSAIYINSQEGVMNEFGVTATEASLGLALFVLGYGVGPLLWSPMSELPSVGRNPVYFWTMFAFVILSIPTALVTNYPGLMVLRFLQGFFGSPCLANGGASLGDLYNDMQFPYALIAWVSAGYCGPALGPLLSGFSVPVLGWRWSLLEILFAGSAVFLVMFALLPETSSATLLLRRAQRLRRLTGNPALLSQSEIDQRGMTSRAIFVDALIKPLEITLKDPAILFVQLYTAVVYATYYSFFESFPLVYPVYYGMTAGQLGLVFLSILVACLLGATLYAAYLHFYMNPRVRAQGAPAPERRLVPALVAAFGPTVGLFIFAWTARPDIHWVVPTVGITLYGAAVFVVFQCIFVYVPTSYPKYAASLFAGNDFFRSALAFAAVLFAPPLFKDLGVARGNSLLGGLSVVGILGIWTLYIFGARLRSMSKFAIFEE